MNSRADFSERRQIVVFSTPDSESGKLVQRSVETLRCQLAERDTDVRFVDIAELPDAGVVLTEQERAAQELLAELAGLRGEGYPEFEVVLIGKDGGVKARTSDPGALEDFLGLIDSMPMRRAEMRSRASDDGAVDGDCE